MTLAGRAATTRGAAASWTHTSPARFAHLARPGPPDPRSIGSSLKTCPVADGSADLYPHLGPTRAWDTAAAQAVLESADGCIMEFAGRPLRYNTKADLTIPHFLAFGDRGRDRLV